MPQPPGAGSAVEPGSVLNGMPTVPEESDQQVNAEHAEEDAAPSQSVPASSSAALEPDKRKRLRRMAVEEILSTEKTHVQSLFSLYDGTARVM